jgi:elongation factor 2
MKILLYDLKNQFTNNLDFIASEPIVSYRETVLNASNQECLAKSSNKLNRLYMKAEPIDANLAKLCEDGEIS